MNEVSVYRAGIIGCGGIAKQHATAYAQHPQVELVAVSDINAEATAKLAGEFGSVAQYTDYKEMLEKEKLDIVSICTWPGLHAEMVEAAAEVRPKAILCEKPMARNLVEADRMIDAANKNGVKLAIAHQHRFNPYWNKAKELIAEGAIGDPVLVHQQTVRGLMNNGTHFLDGMRYILGDPKVEWILGQVKRSTDRWERGGRIEDLTGAIICFEGGVRALMEIDMPGQARPEMRITGTDGMMQLAFGKLRYLNGDGGWQEVALGSPKSHYEQCDELVAWIEGRAEHRGRAESAREVTEILMGIYESARTRDLVVPPVTPGPSPLEVMIDSGDLVVTVPGRVDI